MIREFELQPQETIFLFLSETYVFNLKHRTDTYRASDKEYIKIELKIDDKIIEKPLLNRKLWSKDIDNYTLEIEE